MEGVSALINGYPIPANFTDAGKLLGAFPMRNALEALMLLVPIAVLGALLPFGSISVRLIAVLVPACLVCGLALVGVGDGSLSQFVGGWLRWRLQRPILYYRG